MKKILTVLGARPQFIKASVVSQAISKKSELSEVLVHTGQHFDPSMSDVFFSELGIAAPKYQLNINGMSHGAMTGRMLAEIEKVLEVESADAVLVYGDTNSTLAGALAAIKMQIPVAHVEAGLRSFNISMPEEVNRILTDRISKWLFTPTQDAKMHLVNEGVANERIFPVGDVMFDAAIHHGAKIDTSGGVIARLDLAPGEYLLVTVHRAENTDDLKRLAAIVDSLVEVSESMPIVWPIHPRTRKALERLGQTEKLAGAIHVIEPLGYLDMLQLEKFACVIATDSGGIQKEAFFYEIPCVTLREETEWLEIVNAGWNRLAPPNNSASITREILAAVGSTGRAVEPYGTGNAAKRIVDYLCENISDMGGWKP